jgi:hypothetical protein
VSGAIINTIRIDVAFLRQIARLYEQGIPIKDIAVQLKIDQKTTLRILQLLGYGLAINDDAIGAASIT